MKDPRVITDAMKAMVDRAAAIEAAAKERQREAYQKGKGAAYRNMNKANEMQKRAAKLQRQMEMETMRRNIAQSEGRVTRVSRGARGILNPLTFIRMRSIKVVGEVQKTHNQYIVTLMVGKDKDGNPMYVTRNVSRGRGLGAAKMAARYEAAALRSAGSRTVRPIGRMYGPGDGSRDAPSRRTRRRR